MVVYKIRRLAGRHLTSDVNELSDSGLVEEIQMTEYKVKIVTPLVKKRRRDGGEGRSCVAVTTNSSVAQIWLTDDAVERNVSDSVYLLLYGCRSRSQDDGTLIIIVTKETKLYFYLSVTTYIQVFCDEL